MRRVALSLVLDGLVVGMLVAPGLWLYARWLVFALYVLLSVELLRQLSEHYPWLVRIVRDRATRIAHGLEHATIAVLEHDTVPVTHGFTHGTDRFVVAFDAGHGGQLTAVRQGAESALRRMCAGQRSLAYHPRCGTSLVAAAVTLWLAYVVTLVFAVAMGRSAVVFVVAGVVVFRIWRSCVDALNVLAQRLFTVSTAFASASVVDVREVTHASGYRRPDDQTWFEIVVDVRAAATEGGAVAPGVLV